jgi:NADH:ubiquinone oxidoreductase subunit B-like Fe-S oxidoreductase
MQQFKERNIITTSTDKLFSWSRKNSLYSDRHNGWW